VSCITVASFITIIGTGVQDPSVLVKNNVPIHWQAINKEATLSDVIGAMTNSECKDDEFGVARC